LKTYFFVILKGKYGQAQKTEDIGNVAGQKLPERLEQERLA
jgi:hypothetical protein